MCFKRHPDGRWGLEPQRWPDGHTDFWRPLGEQDKPWLLRGQDHGTQVVLLGQHERARHHPGAGRASPTPAGTGSPATSTPASCASPPRSRCSSASNTTASEPGQLQHVHGEQHHLERRADRRGCRGAERRGRALVGARRRSSRPPPRSRHLDLDRSRRRGARRRALRHPAADPRRLRAPSGLRHPLRLRARRAPPPAPGRAVRRLQVQHRPHHCCSWTTSRSRGPAGARSSPPPCPTRSASSRNAPPTPTASHAEKRSADASARSCRSTDSADTGQPNRHGNHPPSHPASAPAMSPAVVRRPGPKHTAPRRPQNRRTPLPTETRPTTGRTVSRPQTTPCRCPCRCRVRRCGGSPRRRLGLRPRPLQGTG